MVREDVNAVLKHLSIRQAAGEVPFRFFKLPKATRNKTAAVDECNGDIDTGSDAEAEDDLQEGNGVLGGGSSINRSVEQASPGQSMGDAAENACRVCRLLKYEYSKALTSLNL